MKKTAYLDWNCECKDLFKFKIQVSVCIFGLVKKSNAYKIDHRFFLDDVLKRSTFRNISLVRSTITRDVDPNLQRQV